ncbi:hypothetical protein CEXT_667501 [Caerostris extrusa]|uniref:Uncharacterized protein n=1 Tax=Caerostris extrusa TaxID=172846 RepID=A0AAV4TKB2_CAEEX|nr:hypothetical protein CEXT_667501 [Caerostris extrusa]
MASVSFRKGLYLYLGAGMVTVRGWSLSLGGNDLYVGAEIESIYVRNGLYLCAEMASSVHECPLSLCGNGLYVCGGMASSRTLPFSPIAFSHIAILVH